MDTTLKGYAKRVLTAALGLALSAYGIGMTVKADLGISPWDVFSQGIALQASRILGVEVMIGTVTQIVGVVVLLAVIALREKIGVATFIDIYLFGECLNIFLKYDLYLFFDNIPFRLVCVFVGYIFWGLGVYTYMSSQMGAGPRDSLMVALAKRNVPVSIARNAIEFIVFVIGWIAGGSVGVGTVIAVLVMGPILNIIFKIFKFDVTKVKNESIFDTAKNIRKSFVKE